jgi:hypothetical protein
MAIFTPSSLISEIRGSVGQETYSRNRVAPVVKSKIQPYPVDNPQQLDWQGRLQDAVAAWHALDEPTRNEFITAAQDRIKMLRLGYKKQMSGYTLFVSRYLLASKAGEELNLYPLNKRMSRKYQLLGIDLNTGSFEAVIKNPTALASTMFSIFATPPLNPGHVSIGESMYRLIVEADQLPDGLTLFDISAAYAAKYEAISGLAGKRIGIGLKCFNYESGETTALFCFNQIVQTI